MCKCFNESNFRINVFVYHPGTSELVTSYALDQYVSQHRDQFNRTVKACHDSIEAAQSTDGLTYIAYIPVWESWRKGGNRVFETTVRA